MSYTGTKFLTILFVLSVFVGGVYADHLPHRDYYPFFSWSLFSNVSHRDKSFFVRVKNSSDDRGVLIYSSRVSQYMNVDFLPDYFWTIQEIGNNIVDGVFDPKIKDIENLFKQRPYSFEIVQLEYDPWTLKTQGNYLSLKVIQEFKLE